MPAAVAALDMNLPILRTLYRTCCCRSLIGNAVADGSSMPELLFIAHGVR